MFFQQQADDRGGEKGNKKLQVKFKAFEIEEFPPVKDQYGDDGAELDVLDEKFGKTTFFDPQDGRSDGQCPVDEIGRNSVIPSTMAMMIAWIVFINPSAFS